MDNEVKRALLLAADALDIAADWHLPAMQVNPPPEWGLDGGGEDAADGWCSTSALAAKLREIAHNAGLNRPGSRSEAEAGGSELKPLLGEEAQ